MDIKDLNMDVIPQDPGIYIFKGEKGENLYVGKAKNLKNRLRSYFGNSRDKRMNINYLMLEARTLDFITTQTEDEALMLENKNIKLRQPKYNVLLKDDKTYSSLRLEINEEFPRISIVRKCTDKNSLYLGPFKSSENLRKTKRFLQKTFGIRDCSNNKFTQHKKRACLYKFIGMCVGPCDEIDLKNTYEKNFTQLKDIFKGKIGRFKKIIEDKMIEFAKREKFEEASFLRDELERLDNNNYFDTINSENLKNTDVIGIIESDNHIQISILFFRGGYIIDKADLFATSKLKDINLEVHQMLKQFYALKSSIPKKIIISNQFKFIDEFKIDLKNLNIFDTRIECVSKGRKKTLVEMAEKNAKMQLESNVIHEKFVDENLNNIKNKLKLITTPVRIECFDISNTQGTNAVASMVVFKNCEPAKKYYRKFKIQTKGPNDYEMMKEAISRRIKRFEQDGWEKPDLILIDGGKGHLNKIKDLIPYGIGVASIAKPRKNEVVDKIYIPERKDPVNFDDCNKTLNILINLRDEAHRFAITFHKSRRSKEMLGKLAT